MFGGETPENKTADAILKQLGPGAEDLTGAISSKQVLDSLPDGITIQDRSFNVIYQNAAMRATFGDKVGSKCYFAYENRSRECEGCGILKVFGTGRPSLVIRTALDRDGNTAYWENACFPIRDASGEIVAAAEVCRDITGRVGLEDEVKLRNIELGQVNGKLQERTDELIDALRRLEKEVEQRERADVELRHAQKLQAVGQLAAGIAHEINTPLQYIGDNVKFLEDSFESLRQLVSKYQRAVTVLASYEAHRTVVEEVKLAETVASLDFLEGNIGPAIHDASEGIVHISKIVKAMKEFAHNGSTAKAAHDLNHALETALTVTRNEYISVADIKMECGEIPFVLCHLSDINQVFLNLIVNAAHAISDASEPGTFSEKGSIGIRTAVEGESVRIEISDTGCGVPDEIKERIFEPFFTTKDVGRGSGQGLAIAHSIIVEKHGGSLTFQNNPGRGTTFTIRLPIRGGAESAGSEERSGRLG